MEQKRHLIYYIHIHIYTYIYNEVFTGKMEQCPRFIFECSRGKKKGIWDFPDGPLVKTPHSQCKGLGFDPCLGNLDCVVQ